MNVERWKRIEQLYHEILAGDPERRAALLEEYCSGDPDLKVELQSLLDARENAGRFLTPEDLRSQIAGLSLVPALPIPGDTLGEYQILDVLGSGGMGVVYRARDSRLDREVALKILPVDATHDPDRVTRFRREARAASTLNHPNIVVIYEIGQFGGTWFIAAELIGGITLRRRLAEGKMPLQEALDITIQCCAALEVAHRAGVVHRDLKPENIMIRPDGVVKIVDFGLARITEGDLVRAGAESMAHATPTTALLGTPRYMSPEQARGQKSDGRTDIFSLGAVLHEMVLGRPAIEGTTVPEIFAALLGSGASDSELRDTRVGAVLCKALERDREARYRSMAEFADDLRKIDPLRGDAAPSLSRRCARFLRRHAATAAVLALLLGGAALWSPVSRWFAAGNRSPDASLKLIPLTSFSGAKDFAALSPDGSRFAFSWNGGREESAERHIYVKAVGAGDPLQLTFAAQPDSRPAWSPDGRQIAFVRRVSRLEWEAYVVPSGGGSERKISKAGDGVSWSADGKWLAIADPHDANGFGGIHLVSLENGEQRELTSAHNATDSAPVYSPDGRWIAFLRENPKSDIFLVPLRPEDGRLARRITFDANQKLPRLSWTGDSREIIYSTQREYGGEGLWRVPLQGGQPRRISSTLLFAGNPSVSLKGDRLAYTETWVDTNIYVSTGSGFDRSGVLGRFGEPVKLIASSREDHSPSFSPDGERIAFVSNRTGHSEIWTSRRDGTGQVQLTHLESFAGTPRWSPDGRWIAFDCIISSNADIYVIGSSGGAPRRLTFEGEPNTKPSWSPDGAWIYFNSDRSGAPELWKMKATGGPAIRLTQTGGREPLASPDGRIIYYTKHLGGAPIWCVPADGGLEQPVPGMEEFDQIGRAWGLLREGIYFAVADKGTQQFTIRFFSLAARRLSVLVSWPVRSAWTGPALALSPDGRSLLTVRTDQEINDLMMIENFR